MHNYFAIYQTIDVIVVNNNGFIRKIDDLGRIVLPKEIRQQMHFQSNENILIRLNDNKVEISKYSYLLDNVNQILNIGKSIDEICKIPIEIYDLDKLIYTNIELFKKDNFVNCIEQDIIYDSIVWGKIKAYFNNSNIDYQKFIKLVSRIISITISNSC